MPYREHAHTSFFIQTIYIEMEKRAKTKRQKQKRWWRRRRRSKTLLQTYSILHLTEFNVNAQPLNDSLCTRARLHTRFSVYLYVCIFMYVCIYDKRAQNKRTWLKRVYKYEQLFMLKWKLHFLCHSKRERTEITRLTVFVYRISSFGTHCSM